MMDRWERSARMRNRREQERAPLLAYAGLVPVHTPAECEARFDAFQRSCIAGLRRMYAKNSAIAAELRRRVAKETPVEVMPRLDACLVVYPPDPVFAAWYWRSTCEAMGISVEVHP